MARKQPEGPESESLKPSGREPSRASMGGWSRGAPFEPSAQDRRVVELMAAHGVPLHEVAQAMLNPRTGRPYHRSTLFEHFREEIERGRRKADDEVVHSLYRQAVGRAKVIVDGEVVEEERLPVTSATIWWTKARMGWKGRNGESGGRAGARAGREADREPDEPRGRVVITLPDNGRDPDMPKPGREPW